MSVSFQETLLADLREVIGVLSRRLDDSDLRRLLAVVGWDLDALTGLPLENLRTALKALDAALDGLPSSPPKNLNELSALLEAAEAAFNAVAALNDLLMTPPDPRLKELGRDLLSFAVTTYLLLDHPVLYRALVVLTVIEPTDIEIVVDPQDAQRLLRLPHRRPVFRPGQIPALIRDPLEVLQNEYLGPRGTPSRDDPLNTKEDARQLSNKLFPRVAALLNQMGVAAAYGVKDYGQDFGTGGNDIAARTLTILLSSDVQPTVATMAGLGFALLSREEADLGLVVTPFGAISLSRFVGNWQLDATISAEVEGFAVGRRGLIVRFGSQPPARIDIAVKAFRLPGDGSADSAPLTFLIGGTTGTRLEIGQFGVAVTGGFEGQTRDFGFLLAAEKCALVVDGSDGDGLVGRVLGANPIRIDFGVAVGWSNRAGLHFRGSGGLEATLAAQVELGGVLKVRAIHLAVLASTDGGDLRLQASASIAAQLGPVGLTADRMGIEAIVDFSAAEKNLGFFNLEFGFKFPNGVEISIDSGPVAGGGFLRFDPEAGRYSGALSLRIYEIDVSAFGIIDTKLPDGSRGFSFAILISARFTPIQLGFGFTLNGVGGMLGINRTVDTARLQDAVRRHTLDHVLFPEEPEKHALAILNDLGAFFPPVEGRYTFGPMALIGWGDTAGASGRVFILEAELGIILELPEPIRLTILGQVKVGLPSLEKRFVKLNFDVVGVLEFAKKSFSLDASLYDSEVGGFTVNGDMALRLNWGEPPNFALAIGGFHPLYRAPAGFPPLRRVTVDLSNIGNPRLTLSGYLALTSNTFQVGAKAELLAFKGSFNIYGWIGFDALFTFQPFTFRADFSAGVALRKGTRHWASIHVSGTLSGPNPWHAQGEACLSLFFFDICVGFDLDLSRRSAEPILPLPNILDELAEELSSPRNWSAEVPPAAHQVVSLVQADRPEDRPLLDPLGAAVVKERLLPLDQKIDRFEHGKLGKKRSQQVLHLEDHAAAGDQRSDREHPDPGGDGLLRPRAVPGHARRG